MSTLWIVVVVLAVVLSGAAVIAAPHLANSSEIPVRDERRRPVDDYVPEYAFVDTVVFAAVESESGVVERRGVGLDVYDEVYGRVLRIPPYIDERLRKSEPRHGIGSVIPSPRWPAYDQDVNACPALVMLDA